MIYVKYSRPRDINNSPRDKYTEIPNHIFNKYIKQTAEYFSSIIPVYVKKINIIRKYTVNLGRYHLIVSDNFASDLCNPLFHNNLNTNTDTINFETDEIIFIKCFC